MEEIDQRRAGKRKHIEIRFLALQQWREEKRLEFEKIRADDHEADVLTNPMSKDNLLKI